MAAAISTLPSHLVISPHFTAEAALLFGRGMRAGIDRREQKKQAVHLERDMMRKARAAMGIEESVETRRAEKERERLADQYDSFDMKVGCMCMCFAAADSNGASWAWHGAVGELMQQHVTYSIYHMCGLWRYTVHTSNHLARLQTVAAALNDRPCHAASTVSHWHQNRSHINWK